MTTTSVLKEPAFIDEKLPPKPDEVKALLQQPEFAEVAKLNAWLKSTHPNVEREWKYSVTAGWYEIPMIHDRRLYYFVPERHDFRLNIVLGEKAIASFENGPFGKHMAALLKKAKRYPEGTMFAFDRHSLEADVAAGLVRAKLAH